MLWLPRRVSFASKFAVSRPPAISCAFRGRSSGLKNGRFWMRTCHSRPACERRFFPTSGHSFFSPLPLSREWGEGLLSPTLRRCIPRGARSAGTPLRFAAIGQTRKSVLGRQCASAIGQRFARDSAPGGMIDVATGARLPGNGTAGTTAPGTAIGMPNFTGTLAFGAGSVYEVEGNAAGKATASWSAGWRRSAAMPGSRCAPAMATMREHGLYDPLRGGRRDGRVRRRHVGPRLPRPDAPPRCERRHAQPAPQHHRP